MKKIYADNTDYVKELEKYAKELNILYVEDDDNIRILITETLEKFFNKVDIATNGVEGLIKYQDFNHDIILSDIIMPEMDGIEMVTKIKELNNDQAIVMLSGNDTKEAVKELINIGISSFTIKPVNMDRLCKILSKRCKLLINQKKSRERRSKL